MRQQIVACQTLQDEINTILAQKQMRLPITWIPSGLHNIPAKLTRTVQETLDALPPTDQVLLAMAYCGNALAGVRTGDYSLVVPRMDDCISLLLGSPTVHNRQYRGVYFMTAGWIRGERNLMTEYQYTQKKYGEKLGQEIFDTMFQHYTDVALLNTGCFDLREAEAETRRTAETLRLGYREIPATLSVLAGLFSQAHPDDLYLTIPPHTEITNEMLVLAE